MALAMHIQIPQELGFSQSATDLTEKVRSKVKSEMKFRIRELCMTGFITAVGLTLFAGDVRMQAQEPTSQTTAGDVKKAQDQKIQQLQDKLEEIQKQLMELKQANSAQPETHHTTVAKASVADPTLTEAAPEVTDPASPRSEPFAFADFTWLNGNARTKDTPYATKFFTPEIRSDLSYTYDFRHPQDDTIVGSSEVFRSSEVTLTDLGIGGDFHLNNVRARVLSQIGLYSTATPRNDASPARGQWDLADAYRYVSEANLGGHPNPATCGHLKTGHSE